MPEFENEIRIRFFNQRSVLIEWPQRIGKVILGDILSLKQRIHDEYKDCIVDIVTAYASILVVFDTKIADFTLLTQKLHQLYSHDNLIKHKPRTWYLPVCYEQSFSPDLSSLSTDKNLTSQEFIEIHCEPSYLVHFIGFLPGFLYLGGLDNRLHKSRRSSPRTSIPKGSVAIGGTQTGIYPISSPAGWHIIGNCPIPLFDLTRPSPCFAEAGDLIKFYPISERLHNHLTIEVEKELDLKTLIDKPLGDD